MAVVEVDQLVVRNDHVVGEAAQIVEHVSGIAEGRLRMNCQFGLCVRCEKGGERPNFGWHFKLAIEMQCAGVEGMAQLCEKQTRNSRESTPHGRQADMACERLAIHGEASVQVAHKFE
nr:hypothetical protein [Burkholderia cepacia]